MGIRRTASAALITALTAGILTMTAGSASALSSEESSFVSKINAERRARGKSTLVVKSDLVSVARAQSARMARKGDIWHNPNLGSSVDGWTYLGENVGMGPSVSSLHKAFMDSPGHRANILKGVYNQVGVGIVIRDKMIYVTEIFATRSGATKTTTTTTVRRTSATGAAPRPAAKAPAPPKPKPVRAQPRTVELLVDLIGMDAEDVDPTTGTAAGF